MAHEQGGIPTTVTYTGKDGKDVTKRVIVKPWIQFIIGDHEGHNTLCDHYNSNSDGI